MKVCSFMQLKLNNIIQHSDLPLLLFHPQSHYEGMHANITLASKLTSLCRKSKNMSFLKLRLLSGLTPTLVCAGAKWLTCNSLSLVLLQQAVLKTSDNLN